MLHPPLSGARQLPYILEFFLLRKLIEFSLKSQYLMVQIQGLHGRNHGFPPNFPIKPGRKPGVRRRARWPTMPLRCCRRAEKLAEIYGG